MARPTRPHGPRQPNEGTFRLPGKQRRAPGLARGSRVGDDLVEAFEEMAAHLRGEIELADVSPRR
jgi:hypothetical protein